jgi:type VI secretion system protein ImpL
MMGAIVLSARGAFSGAWRVAARFAPQRKHAQFERDPLARLNASEAVRTESAPIKREALKTTLRERHGWRWRYRDRWILVSGDESIIKRLAPGLAKNGYELTSGAVLIYGRQTSNSIDSDWLDQIRRLRRRRPVDAVIAVTGGGQTEKAAFDPEELAQRLVRQSRALGWAAPVYLLNATDFKDRFPESEETIGLLWADKRVNADEVHTSLAALAHRLADMGVRRLGQDPHDRYPALVSQHISKLHSGLINLVSQTAQSRFWHHPVHGLLFAPLFKERDLIAFQRGETLEGVLPGQLERRAIWQTVAEDSRAPYGRRVGFYWPNALAAMVMVAAIGWCVAMTVSFVGNRSVVNDAQTAMDAALATRPGTPAAVRTQLALQQQIDTLEYRQQHGAPWYLRAGLNHDDQILAALWPSYATVAARNLRDPAAHQLEATLTQLAQSRADALPSPEEQQRDYRALKTYLMLAQPQHADAAYLAKQLPATWPAVAGMSTGEWLDTSQRLASFYASHLRAHPEWRLSASNDLTTAARNMLVNQIGLQNSDDTLYQSVLEQAKGKYADITLATLINGADARGLFTTSQTVPGIYTRAAWDGMIAEAIDKAAKEGRVAADWVLADERAARVPGAALETQQDTEEVKQRLRARYFADYTAAWQAMLNSIQWRSASNLSDAISQLTRLTDAQTSPLIALTKAVEYQAQAGRASQALADTLVRKAQDLIGNKAGDASAPEVNPLDKPFGPLLALMGDDVVTGNGNANGKSNTKTKTAADFSGVSLAHFLTVATTMRLKLQQIATSADAQAMARQMAQAVFQGKLSELTQARDDAALTAASLGSQWSGLGDALFAKPLDVAWQTILQPAAASLNDAWRASVAAPFASTFDGHYPFADTASDASFVELGRYIKPETGLIARFVTTQLAGMLQPQGNAWTPNELAPQALQFDPEFLSALRQLSTLGAQLYAQGDASYRVQIMANPTPEVVRSILTIDRVL